MHNSTETAVQLPIDKTRRKRLKVVSACSECRRKKTKCNGEEPCAGCIKTKMDCKYSNSLKSRPLNNRPLAASSSPISAVSPVPPPPQSQQQQKQQQQQQETRYFQYRPQPNDESNTTILAIENRLGVIEDILQILLKQQQQQQYHPHQYHQKSAFVPVEQRNMQVRHSGPYYGDYQHDDGGNNYRQSQPQKRKFDQVQHVRLPPPYNYQPSLSESSSTSTTSSICSNSSPKMNTIQALLNNESDIKLDYPTTTTATTTATTTTTPSAKPSAFYRPTAAGAGHGQRSVY